MVVVVRNAEKAVKSRTQSENLNTCLYESFMHLQVENLQSEHGGSWDTEEF